MHPSQANDVYEFYLMCDDVKALIADLTVQGVVCSVIDEQR